MVGPRKQIMHQFSSYEEATAYLFKTIDYEKVVKYKYDDATFSLDRMERLLASIGNPHHELPTVHVAGTKGKGSTAAMLAAILMGTGMKVGLFTSPHLVHLEERIRVNNELISQKDVRILMSELYPYLERERSEHLAESPTFFETLTALALAHFRREKVDLAVMEVGLGGRLDSTNIVHPLVSIITPIGFDHTDKLGDTLAKIAWEKAGIIKQGVPVISGKQEEESRNVIKEVCKGKKSKLYIVGSDIRVSDWSYSTRDGKQGIVCSIRGRKRDYDDIFIPLLGEHQVNNCAVAVAAAELLEEMNVVKISKPAIKRALAKLKWHGRIEVVSCRPLIIIDSAHNTSSMRALRQVIVNYFQPKRIIFIIGMARDKDIKASLSEIVPLASKVILTKIDNPRAAEPQALLNIVKGISDCKVTAITPVESALEEAKESANNEDMICITGSFYLAGKIMEIQNT